MTVDMTSARLRLRLAWRAGMGGGGGGGWGWRPLVAAAEDMTEIIGPKAGMTLQKGEESGRHK